MAAHASMTRVALDHASRKRANIFVSQKRLVGDDTSGALRRDKKRAGLRSTDESRIAEHPQPPAESQRV